MLDIVIAVVVAGVLIAGFWWTRGYGGMPGGMYDPAKQELLKYTRTGRRFDPEDNDDG